jgi:monooxygenase
MSQHFDVVIVGAGISGVGAACHLSDAFPGKSYTILEGRAAIGGTWDLFRYPGIRSDSDMYTLGYKFEPWKDKKSIADGDTIRHYVEEVAHKHGVDRKIRFGHQVKRASWSSDDARWTLEVERGDETLRFTCNFFWVCAGYYSYAEGYVPELAGIGDYKGRIVYPQFWPEDLDYEDKRVIVIGSGATAMTIVPEMAKKAALVTMLQRSPTYVASVPAVDPVATWLRENLPSGAAYSITRVKNVFLQAAIFQLSRRRPKMMRKFLLGQVKKALPGYDVDTHFTPRYNPWDQRLCAVPDGDLFASIREGKTEVVTDHIDTFTARGIKTRSGRELEADIVVMATGLKLQFLGGLEITVDGRRVDPGNELSYKGAMLSGVPNMASTFGYTNASWTLKADLTSEWVCRLLKHMEDTGAVQVTPRRDPDMQPEPFVDFSSGYLQRALAYFPKQGAKRPWRVYQNYFLDMLMMGLDRIDDGVLEFRRAPARAVQEAIPDRRVARA